MEADGHGDAISTIAEMLATDLGCRYQQGDKIEGTLVVQETKETLLVLDMDSSLTTRVLTTLVDRGYLSRKGAMFIYQNKPGQNGRATTH